MNIGLFVTSFDGNPSLNFGICPFCYSNNFVYNEDKFTCFSCNKHGNAADFLAYKNSVSYTTAQWQIKHEDKQGLYAVNSAAAEYYASKLYLEDNYLRKRMIPKECSIKHNLGYADGKLGEYLRKKGFSQEQIQAAGLCKPDGKDMFYKRIVFPVFAPSGKILGFGGRRIDDSKAPKYLNSPETEIFKKKECLYGIQAIKSNKPVYLVEGYMDVVALQQHGFNAVAALGTATNNHHVQLLKSLGIKDMIISLDGDEAGIKNAIKAINVFKNDFNLSVLNFYKDCKDPDEFLKKYSKSSFEKLPITSWQSFMVRHGVNPIDIL